MTSLNLHALAAQVVRESASPDPGSMVEAFAAAIDPADYLDAIKALARPILLTAIHSQRDNLNGGAPLGGSRKVDAAREAWKRALATPEFIPSAGWIFLRDATREQVLEMAGVRMQKSKELAASAKQYQGIAKKMVEAGVAHVSDLPDDTLESLLAPVKGRAA